MSDNAQQPKFATAMRGYDKLQVDEYVERLQAILSDAEERARLAEAELEFSRHATVGPRVSQILDLAVEEAKELRQKVDTEVELTRSHTRAQCEESVSRARDTSAQIRSEAESARADILADADAKRLAVLAEVERLSRGRDGLLRDLERLQHVLSQATSAEFVALPAALEPPDAHDVLADAGHPEVLVELAG